MNPKVINPYTLLGTTHKESLDYIIANLPVDPTFDDLNNKLTESFFIPDPDDPSLLDELEGIIKTILSHAYNGYVNGNRLSVSGDRLSVNESGNGYWRYHENQMRVIGQMLNGINSVPVEAIGEFLNGMEAEMVSGELSYEEQIPLLVAAQVGKSGHEYWMAQIATPGAWAVYLNADSAVNYMHVAAWVSAAMQGALLTYGLIKPPQIQFMDIHTSVISSVGLAAGKVMWGWVSIHP